MYEALRQMTDTTPEGELVDVAPGEIVAGFETWPLRNQLAAINMHMVRYRVEGEGQKPLTYRANEKELREARERLIAAAAQKNSSILDSQAADDSEEQETSILRCKLCDYTTHSSQGLKTHLSRKHKV